MVADLPDREGGKRVVFMFDSISFNTLQEMTRESGYPSMGMTVRDSLRLADALQTQAKQGFTEVIVRNPQTGDERKMFIPTLE